MSTTLGRYAPGNYSCRCTACDKEFTGDKRATTCLQCAGKEQYNAGMERAAEIADEEHLNDKYRHGCTNQDAAKAIRKEIEK